MSHRRKLSLLLTLTLVLGVIAATASTASATASDRPPALVSNVHEPRGYARAHTAWIGGFLQKLVGHVVHKARPVVRNYVVRRVVRKYAWEWTKQQAVQWYCGRWDAYFGYNRHAWYWAAHYYYHPNWAWRICLRYGYLG